MIKYAYIIGNSRIETLNLLDIPEGLEYETIEFEIIEPNEEIPKSISPAEFTYGLALQDITDSEVLDFIDNHIEDAEMQLKARILFTKATEFEYNNPLLVVFFPLFSQYIQKQINYDNIFINGITLNT